MPDLNDIALHSSVNLSRIVDRNRILELDSNPDESRLSTSSNPLSLYVMYEQEVIASSSGRVILPVFSGPTVDNEEHVGEIPYFYYSQLNKFATPRTNESELVWFTLDQVCNHRKENNNHCAFINSGISRVWTTDISKDPPLEVDTIIGDLRPLIKYTKNYSLPFETASAFVRTQKILNKLKLYLEDQMLIEEAATDLESSKSSVKFVQNYLKYLIERVLSATIYHDY